MTSTGRDARDAKESGERIEELLTELRTSTPEATMDRVEELVERVVGLYGAGLARIVSVLYAPSGSLDGAQKALALDPVVSSLLVLHSLHPEELRVRVERGLTGVRPYVESHGGKVSLVAIEEDVVKLRLEGTCESCSSSTETATELLERAVRDAAPEIARVEVDAGAAEKNRPKPSDDALVQIRRSKAEHAAQTGSPSRPEVPSEARTEPPPPLAVATDSTRCEMCSTPIAEQHDHVARIEPRDLLCVCRACWLLFEDEGAGRGNYRAVSNRWVAGPSLDLSDLAWAALGIPVRMAFFVMDSSRGGPVGRYPSPGGAIEADIDDDAWRDLRQRSDALDSLRPDVEAWLVDGRARAGVTGYIVPIDACYELVARLRRDWRGFDGGDLVRAAIEAFFEGVKAKASGKASREERELAQVHP